MRISDAIREIAYACRQRANSPETPDDSRLTWEIYMHELEALGDRVVVHEEKEGFHFSDKGKVIARRIVEQLFIEAEKEEWATEQILEVLAANE